MKIAPIADIKAHLSAYLKESEKGPIVVTKNGKPIAVLLGIRDEDEIERLVLAYSPKFKSILSKGRQQIRGRREKELMETKLGIEQWDNM